MAILCWTAKNSLRGTLTTSDSNCLVLPGTVWCNAHCCLLVFGQVLPGMIWCDAHRCWLVWFGAAWYVWCDAHFCYLVWFGVTLTAADRYSLVQHSPWYDAYRRCWLAWFGTALSVVWCLPLLLTGMVWYSTLRGMMLTAAADCMVCYSTLRGMMLTAAADWYGLVQHSPWYDAYRFCLEWPLVGQTRTASPGSEEFYNIL